MPSAPEPNKEESDSPRLEPVMSGEAWAKAWAYQEMKEAAEYEKEKKGMPCAPEPSEEELDEPKVLEPAPHRV